LEPPAQEPQDPEHSRLDDLLCGDASSGGLEAMPICPACAWSLKNSSIIGMKIITVWMYRLDSILPTGIADSMNSMSVLPGKILERGNLEAEDCCSNASNGYLEYHGGKLVSHTHSNEEVQMH
jgi:hypothetical protein